MKNLTLKIVFLLSGFLFLSSCVLDQDKVDFGEGPVIVQFPSATANASFVQKNNGATTDYIIPLQSYGGDNLPTTADVTATVAVAASSQVKDGVEITIPNKTVVIPAGKNSGNLTVKVSADKLVVGTPKTLVLEIASASGTVSNNKKTFTATLKAICESNLAGEYTYTNGTKLPATIKATTTGNYDVSRDNAYNSAYNYTFSDNCGVLTVTGGGALAGFGYPTSGTGSVNAATGEITIVMTAEGLYANRTMILKKN